MSRQASRRNPRAGLFTGYWHDMGGKKIRRIRRDEYPELYRLHRQYAAERLGLAPVGMRAPWTLSQGRVEDLLGQESSVSALPSENVYGNLHPGTA